MKYSNKGTKIIIEGKYIKNNDSFLVSIRNQGIPLLPDHYKKIFERAFRSEEAKNKYPAGTGFGLYIARRIVEIHEGTLEASVHDGWTNFKVTLSVKGLKGKARFRD